MTDSNTKWAVTVHRKDGDESNEVLQFADSAEAAIEATADHLDLDVDAAGNVTGDKEIVRLTAVAAPDAPVRNL